MKCKREFCNVHFQPKFTGHQYHSKNCADRDVLERMSNVDQALWASTVRFTVSQEENATLASSPVHVWASYMILKHKPPGAVAIRVGCPKSETPATFKLRWFPARGQNFSLSQPFDISALSVPLKGKYLIAYLGEGGDLLEPPQFKVDFSWGGQPHLVWGLGDRSIIFTVRGASSNARSR